MAAPKKNRGLGKGLDALFGDVEVSFSREADSKVNEDNKETKDKSENNPDTDNKLESASDKKKSSSDNDAADSEKETADSGISYIDINDIKPNSNQPRKTFDEDKLDELAASIEAHGLIQPVVLRKSGNGYEIVAGERRWRAARKIGIKELPCIVKELTDEENMLLAIIENMQREDLNPIEEAEGISQMIDTYGLTQEQVSKSVGKSRPYITNSLRLLKLSIEVRDMVAEGSISIGHAKAILSVTNEERQYEIAEKVIREGLSVRQTEKLAKEEKTPKKKSARKAKDADIKRVEEDLKEVLGTKVTLNQKGKKGKIEIEFYSKDELERLIDMLKTIR